MWFFLGLFWKLGTFSRVEESCLSKCGEWCYDKLKNESSKWFIYFVCLLYWKGRLINEKKNRDMGLFELCKTKCKTLPTEMQEKVVPF